ncbi:Coenzyme F420 hydrogenase/dehydrogenase, beta subunit C-terminal domain [bacterium]|nr:Coenzyme F420 hydrogenase/dehydrogenase, beta subunit C-terminal domain [bacterium]
MSRANSVVNITEKKICCGCGACSVICPVSCIDFTYGKRFNYPKVDSEKCIDCGKCLKVCPSEFLLHGTDPEFSKQTEIEDLKSYLLYSPDDDIRLDSSSGGFITGLILHLMEKGQIDGAIIAKSQGDTPWIAKSVLATTRQELLDSRASKYAPVSNCTALKDVLEKPGRYAFVGTPCMCEGLKKLQDVNPVLKERVVLSVGFVCAGMASRQSTLAFLERYDVDLEEVYKISYRGDGWPGNFRVFNKQGEVILKKPLLGCSLDLVVPGDHYLRCNNCLDHWSNYADIVVSDPWKDDMVDNEMKGWSGIMIRSQSGQEAVDSAIASGDMIANEVSSEEMYNYNKHLIITADHKRHSWMALYQLLFFWRFKGMSAVFRSFLKWQGPGLLTTLRSRFDRNYYENTDPRKKLLKANTGATEHLRLRSEAAHKK